MIKNSINFEPDQFSLTRECYRLLKTEQILRIPTIIIRKKFFDTNGIIKILLKACFNDPKFQKFGAKQLFYCQRRLQALENVGNFVTTTTRYIEVSFRHEVSRWITIKSIFQFSKLHEILIQTNYCSTEVAGYHEKRSKY